MQISQVLGHGAEVSIILSQHGKREEFDVGASDETSYGLLRAHKDPPKHPVGLKDTNETTPC